MEAELDLLAAPAVGRTRYIRKPANYGEWEFLKGDSTATLTKLIETVAREFKARGLTLTFKARACRPGGRL